MGNGFLQAGRLVHLSALLCMVVALVLPLASVPATSAQGAIVLQVDGSSDPVAVPIGSDVNLLITGMAPAASLTVAWYAGANCGQGLVGTFSDTASGSGAYSGSLGVRPNNPATWYLRATSGPTNSNCVQVTWEALPTSPTPIPPATNTPIPTPYNTPVPTRTSPSPTAMNTPVPQNIVLTADGVPGPLTVPVGTNLPLVGTGLTPGGPFTYAAYEGGDCGLDLGAAQDFFANDAGEWSGTNLSSDLPVTWWIRLTDGPTNSNCVQITWQSTEPSPTPTATATATATSTVTATSTITPEVTATSPATSTSTSTSTVEPTWTSEPTLTATPDSTVVPTSPPKATDLPAEPTLKPTSPVSALPTTGGGEDGTSPAMLGVLVGMSLALLVMAATQIGRRTPPR